MQVEATQATRRIGRRHGVSPAPEPLIGGSPGPAGMEVLAEVEGELAVLLWRAARDLWSWTEGMVEVEGVLIKAASCPAPIVPARRLADAIMEAPELAEQLRLFAVLLGSEPPPERRAVGEACARVQEWADRRSLLGTALLFAEAAAYAEPELPQRAYGAAQLARRLALDARASGWYQRTFGLAVRTRDTFHSILALLGYGRLLQDLGRLDEAKRVYARAARRAARRNRRREAGLAAHDLMLLCAQRGEYTEAERHAARAVTFYPLQHPRSLHLAHDIAFLLVRRRHFGAARWILEKALPSFGRTEERTLVLSTLAWAAAGVGETDRFAAAERAVQATLGESGEYAAAAFLHLAEGARALHRWELAERHAAAAARAAILRREAALGREAHALLHAVQSRDAAPGEVPPSGEAEMLARRVAARLQKWKAPGPQGPGALSRSG